MCLRQIFHLGAAREGKQDRYSFYEAVLWLWQRQPATVLYPQSAYSHSVRVLMRRLLEQDANSQATGQVRYFHDQVASVGTGAP